MERNQIESLIRRVKGVTFASLDAHTTLRSLRRIVVGEQVLLFAMGSGSGYENMINRRLVDLGLDPSFRVQGLPWGTRVDDTPLIEHNGQTYLQTLLFRKGKEQYMLGEMDIPVSDIGLYGVKSPYAEKEGQAGLPADKRVVIQTYNLSSLRRLTVMGQTVLADQTREKLSLRMPS